jgi:lipoprotein-releasing system permease protein
LKLNPEVYYIDKVPIELNVWAWLALNIGTLIVCLLALIIPSYAITRISPVKAIRFN